MPIGKLFHLTLLVDDLAAFDHRFLGLFAPHCFYRGYAPLPLDRTASLHLVSNVVIEPMQPHRPAEGARGTTIYRMLERYGPCVHNVAFYSDDLPALEARMQTRGIRTTDGGMGVTLFTHPKDFPGLIELCDHANGGRGHPMDPRMAPGFSARYWREWHPLGIEGSSHVTVVTRDLARAVDLYTDVLGARPLPEQPSVTPGARSAYVAVGDDTVIELAEPVDESCPVAGVLERIGETVCGLTFRVADTDRARVFAEGVGAPTASRRPGWFEIDRAAMFGTFFAFTDRPLVGDPRPPVR